MGKRLTRDAHGSESWACAGQSFGMPVHMSGPRVSGLVWRKIPRRCGRGNKQRKIQIRSSLAVRLATPFVDWAPCRGGRICVCYASQDRKEILAKAKAAASSTMGYDGKISDHATIGYAPKRWVVSIVFL